jgi:hypothetical protein
MPQIDVRDPGADPDIPGRGSHQLRRRDRIVVDFGAEHRIEAGILGCTRDILNIAGSPARPRDQPDGQFLGHLPSPQLFSRSATLQAELMRALRRLSIRITRCPEIRNASAAS